MYEVVGGVFLLLLTQSLSTGVCACVETFLNFLRNSILQYIFCALIKGVGYVLGQR